MRTPVLFPVSNRFAKGLTLFLTLFIILTSTAQYGIRDYSFIAGSGTFTAISGGVVLGDPTCDDQLFNDNTTGVLGTATGIGFPIGFPFTFGGADYSSFAVSNNGYIKLGNGSFTIMNSTTTAFSAAGDSLNQLFLIGGLHMDLKNQTGSQLSFVTVGSTGNRELVVEWKNFRYYDLNNTDPEDFTFQIRLQENGNKIVYVYKNFVKNTVDRQATVGLKGQYFNDVHVRKVLEADNDTWATSEKSLLPDAKCDLKTAFKPTEGQTYTFAPPIPTPNDAGALAILVRPGLTSGCPATNAENIKVILKNFGTEPQSAIPYKVVLNGVVVANATANYSPALASGGRDTVAIAQTLDLFAPGNYTIKVATGLANDTGVYMANDTARFSFTNFGAVAVPSQTINNFNQFAARGWKQYKGAPKPQTPGGEFTSSALFFSQTTAVFQSAFATTERKDWLISPTYEPKPNMTLKFRAAVTGFDTITPVSGIGDDEFKVLVSTDCGATWSVVKTFNNTAVTSGEINHTRKGFQVSLANISSQFQVAFFAADKNTVAANSYYFHVDDVVVGQGNAYDMAALRLSIDNQTNPGCNLASFPVKVWVKNVGDSAVASYKVSVKVNNAAPVNQTITPATPMAKGDSAEITFAAVAITPNGVYKLIASSQALLEDGYSSFNDTTSTSFTYLGSTNPLALPSSINFNTSSTGIPTDWLVDQGASLDFKVRNNRGVGSTKCISAGFNPNNPSSFAIMPVTQPLPANYMLGFDVKFSNDFGPGFHLGRTDSLVVQASDNCGDHFTTLFRIDSLSPMGVNAFGHPLVDFSAFGGKAISIRFFGAIKRTDFSGAWIDIDNIGLSPNTGVNEQLENQLFSFFPNPAQNHLSLRNKAGETTLYQILDINGREVRSGSFSGETEVQLGLLQKGVYWVEGKNKSGIIRKKLIIQ